MMNISFPTFFSSSLLYPNKSNLSRTSLAVKPSLVHLRLSKTSSRGIFSCMKPFSFLPNSGLVQDIQRKHQRTTLFLFSLLPFLLLRSIIKHVSFYNKEHTRSTASLLMASRAIEFSTIFYILQLLLPT